MSYVPKRVLGVSLLLVGLAGVSGCATKDTQMASLQQQVDAQQEQLNSKQVEIDGLESSRSDMRRLLDIKQTELDRQNQANMMAAPLMPSDLMQKAGMREESLSMLPPKARAGECYARVLVPPTYKTETKRVLKSEASERLSITPAKYEWVEEKVMVQGPAEKLEVVPATYAWMDEQVMVRAASSRVENVPAVYATMTERVVDQPAHTMWKKGRGPLEKIDHSTGDIMCLVEVPATYKTVTKRVVKTPATTRNVAIPAEYKTVRQRVMKTPPSTRTVKIPAEYKTMRVKKLVSSEKVNRIPIAA